MNLVSNLFIFYKEISQELEAVKEAESHVGVYDIYELEQNAKRLKNRIACFRKEKVPNQEWSQCNALFQKIQDVFHELQAKTHQLRQKIAQDVDPKIRTRRDHQKADLAFATLNLIRSEMSKGPLSPRKMQSVHTYDANLSTSLGNGPIDHCLRSLVQSGVQLAKTYSE